MRAVLVVALVPSVAAADRAFEASPFVGISITAAADRWQFDKDDFRLPKSPVLGVMIAWERDPFTLPVRSRETWRDRLCWLFTCDYHVAPELQVLRTRGRTITTVGLRIEKMWADEPEEPTKAPISRGWLAPHIGVLDDGRTTVYGADFNSVWNFGRTYGFMWNIGANTWRERERVLQLTTSFGVVGSF